MPKRIHHIFECLLFVWSISVGVRAAENTPPRSSDRPRKHELPEVNVSVGAKSMVGAGMWGFLPLPVSVVVNVDAIRYLRIHGEITGRILNGGFRGSLGAGSVFTPVGKNALTLPVGFQLKIPLLFELGVFTGTTEAADGFSDYNEWLLLGPSTGLDMTWWFRGKAGFRISLNAGYMFRVDLGSRYADDYSMTEDTFGVFESAILLGVAF